MLKFVLTVLCVSYIYYTNAAKILCIFPTYSRSHFAVGEGLVRALAAKGHEVTYMSPYKDTTQIQNVKSVHLNGIEKFAKETVVDQNMLEAFTMPPILFTFFIAEMSIKSGELLYSDPAVQDVLNGKETYDAVILEWMMSDYMQGIAYRMQVPSIVVTTFCPSASTSYVSGNPSIYSYMPHMLNKSGQKMNFWERTTNILLGLFDIVFGYFYFKPLQEGILYKYVPDAPSIYELNANISLHLFNSDPIINGPLPMLPNVLEVGGIHMKPPKKLPDDLQKYIDESEHGVIYFSLGGNVKSKDIPQSRREEILRVLSKLKQRVLWKFEEDLPEKPKNVETRKWFPQQDILAHPNVKAFITHGGLLSLTESVYHGVPVVGIPVFGDQDTNMLNAEIRGFGISLPYKEFTEEKFADALDKILNDKTFSERAKKMATLINDQQFTPAEKSVHWIEYVIRHKGLPHLRSASHDLTWYQYHSLDVILLHYAVGEGLVRALADKGHEITYMTPYKDTTPIKNVKSVHLNEIEKFAKEAVADQNILEAFTMPPILFMFVVAQIGIKSGELLYSDPAVQDVLNGKETYDAVILEWMMSDYMQGIAYRMQVPSIVVTTFCPSASTSYVSGNPSIYSYMPHMLNKSGQKMNFWERTTNFLLGLFDIVFGYLYFKPLQEGILYKYVPEAPSIDELNANISLHLFNSDPIINGPLPMLPNVLEVGGIHMKPPKKLPDDLQKYIDESEHGVIYFSLGGNVKSKDIPQSRREEILRVLSKLKQRVLWKFEEDLPEKPKNVETRKWFPQQDILAHPNVKAFITHGGLLSLTESVYHGVPVVGIPVFGDQDTNMLNAEIRGFGISLPYKEFTEEKFANALDKILNDKTFSERAKKMAALINDQQFTPAEKSVHWIEYVIRHKGLPHLRSASHDLAWYQYHSLDVILFVLYCTNTSKILCIFPTYSLSHFAIGQGLVRGLAAKGHHVTYVTPFEEKEPIPNVKSVFLTEMDKWARETGELVMADPAIQEILNSNETYDAVILEWVSTDYLQSIAYRLKAPAISATTFCPGVYTNYVSGNPNIYSHMPHLLSGYGQNMNLWERTNNFVLSLTEALYRKLYHIPRQEKFMHKHVPDAPSIYEMNANISLHLFNSDPILNGPLPMLPNVIEIGGIHMQPPKKLPDDLQKYIDESEHGVIYFSLGGNMQSRKLSEETRNGILRVFSKLKQRILWKFEEDLPGKPPNVETRSWLPQLDILAHPNVKLFITHGGLLSTTETLYYGVPIVGVPVFGDQAVNIKNAEDRGFGLSLPLKEFTEKKFSYVVEEVLNNPLYSRTVKQISALLRDQPATPVERAVYWVEYVVRHKGTPHLRSIAHDLNWFQYYCLDVISFLILINIVTIKVLWVVCKRLCSRKKQKQKTN
ncbi:UDP-glucosyltransferase [Holotrichia oblita]|uniref:UDP-glucosyltransferase n=1 Tax=Holotrichia oblita TaxID=644536 RepID=A0ACB9T5J1_HOLOL|nr:UDP-glucosyltransferase [Holotrichia oblita]